MRRCSLVRSDIYTGVNYYLSCWYRRSEFGIRAAIFFSAAALAGSFGGLLAAAIANMDGIGGKPGWAWIFILEGLATIVIAVLSYFMVGFTFTIHARLDLIHSRSTTSPMKPNSSQMTTAAVSSGASDSTSNPAPSTKNSKWATFGPV